LNWRQKVWGFSIKNFKVFEHHQVLGREIENGVVLVNLSYNPYEFNISELILRIAFKKINGLSPTYKNGAAVGKEITGEPLNSIFLAKDNLKK